MKKQKSLLILLLFTFIFQVKAQDKNFLNRLNHADVSKANELASMIVDQSSTKYKLLKTKIKPSRQVFYFIPSTTPEEEINSLQIAKRVFLIEFYVIKNSDGSEFLKLKQIRAPFEDLSHSWKKYFRSDFNKELASSKRELLHSKADNFHFSIYKQTAFKNDIWLLLNKS